MSSSAIWEGPSSPIETPACEPARRRSTRLIAAMRTKSYAREKNAAKVDANAFQPRACSPTAAATSCCSAMYISKKRSGCACLKISANVELLTSPSRATTSPRADPRAASASPYAFRVATSCQARIAAARAARPGSGAARRAPAWRPQRDVADAAELLDRRVWVVERLAVPAVLVLDGLDALALDRAGHDHRRAACRLRRFLVRAVDLLDVVSVDLDRIPAEGSRALDIDARVPADHGLAALAEPVHVDDRSEVVELVVRRVLVGLPDRALRHLAVAAEHPDT